MGIQGSKIDMGNLHRNLVADRAACVIDLSTTEFVDPYGLVGVACVAAAAMSLGRLVDVHLPPDHGVVNYMSRMGLGEAFDRIGVSHSLQSVTHHPQEDYLLPLSRFGDTHGAELVADLLYTRLEGKVDGQMLEELHGAVGELGNNVDEHSGAAAGGFVAAQTYRRNQPDEYVIVAVGDPGIGLRASLTKSIQVADDEQAVRIALMKDTSGTGIRGRGQGLYYFTEFARLFGWACVYSGGAWHRVATRSHTVSTNHFPGTIIGMHVRCKRS